MIVRGTCTQELNFDRKIIFMSRYTADEIGHRGVLYDGVNFISKPFSKRDIAVKVHETLHESAG